MSARRPGDTGESEQLRSMRYAQVVARARLEMEANVFAHRRTVVVAGVAPFATLMAAVVAVFTGPWLTMVLALVALVQVMVMYRLVANMRAVQRAADDLREEQWL